MAEKFAIYAGEPMAAVLAGHEDARSQRINQVCADYRAILADHMPAMTRGEWCAIMDATNGLAIPTEDAANTRRYLWAKVADAPELAEKWGIDSAALVQRLRSMTTVELVAACEASRAFWQHPDRNTDEALQLAGVRISA